MSEISDAIVYELDNYGVLRYHGSFSKLVAYEVGRRQMSRNICPTLFTPTFSITSSSQAACCPLYGGSRSTNVKMESSTLSPASRVSSDFLLFTKLPIEIRLRVWWLSARASPCRVIQVFYNRDTGKWSAGGFAGGLPTVTQVCREAREEALKSYSQVFDAYVDLEWDTIFANDPAFGIRKATVAFTMSEHASMIRHFAIDDVSYKGVLNNHLDFPHLCESMATILRKRLRGIQSFTIILNEEEVELDDDESEDDISELNWAQNDEDQDEGDDWDNDIVDGINQNEIENLVEWEGEDDTGLQNGDDGGNEDEANEAINNTEEHDFEDFDMAQSFELHQLSKLYHQDQRNLHFVNPTLHPFFGESCQHWADSVQAGFREEKEKHQAWIRPTISILTIKEGLGPVQQRLAHPKLPILTGFPSLIHSLEDHYNTFGCFGTRTCYLERHFRS